MKRRCTKNVNPPCMQFPARVDMSIDAPTMLDLTVADMNAPPHHRYALRDVPCVDYSEMGCYLAHPEHTCWVDVLSFRL